MTEQQWLIQQFEEHQTRLRTHAYRMLGSIDQANEAVQRSKPRLGTASSAYTEHLAGWLIVILARGCVTTLRSRNLAGKPPRRQQRVLRLAAPNRNADSDQRSGADQVGLALLVVLERLSPPERLAFMLHDLLGIPLHDTARILGRSPDATERCAHHARQRLRGEADPADPTA